MPLDALALDPYDEAFDGDARPRQHYAAVLDALAAMGPRAAAEEAGRRAARMGLAVGDRPLAVDPVPRVLSAAEWEPLAAGLAQRARALDAVVRAVYAGAPHPLPAALLDTCVYLERDLLGVPAGGPAVGIVGFDVVRGPDGVLRVLEDNVLTPGHAALPPARELNPLLDRTAAPPAPIHAPARAAFSALLGDPGAAAILGDDPPAWELRWLGRELGVPVVSTADLRGDARGVRERRTGRPIAVLWQRTAEDRLRDDAGGLTHLGEVLLAPLRAGTVRLVTRPGAGVVHDKRAIPWIAVAIRELLGEPPLLEAVRTLDPALHVAHHAETLAAPAAFVVKPANGAGGRGIRFGDEAAPGEIATLLEAEPGGWVAQPRLALSVHPTVAGDALVGRPVDLRAFAVQTPGGWTVLPGGVSRFPTRAGAHVVNTSAGGGIKDVWILP